MKDNDKLRRKARSIDRALRNLFPDAGIALRFASPWQCMVAVQLSAQCTDKKVNEVTATLFKKYRTLDDYVRAMPREFERAIKPTGFYRSKAKNILAAARMVQKRFGGKLPKTVEEMIRIPGVGRKTANVVLGNVYGVSEGIAVDTHVRRLTRQWGLTKHQDPEKIERDLMGLLPRSSWLSWTYRVIEYGRKYAPARKKSHVGEPLERFYV